MWEPPLAAKHAVLIETRVHLLQEIHKNMRLSQSCEMVNSTVQNNLNMQKTIYKIPLSCSVHNDDRWKIEPIRELLKEWGFYYYTLGLVTQQPINGKHVAAAEKAWAQSGDGFIAILTTRDTSMASGMGLPPAWTHTESGMAYSSDRPQLVFVETGVRVDALFNQLDSDHVIAYDPYNPLGSLAGLDFQLNNFRAECQRYRDNQQRRRLKGLVKLAGIFLVGYYARGNLN